MIPPRSPRRRLPWVLGSAALLAAGLAVALLSGDRDPPSPPPASDPAGERTRAEERPPAPSPPPPGAPALPPPPGSGQPAAQAQVPPPAETHADAPTAPPTAVSPVPEEGLEIPPEAPQTPEWRLEKTELIAQSLGKRVQRLEAEIREAEARGDREGAATRRTLLERSRLRASELEREIAELREQVRADGGKTGSPGGTGDSP